MKRSIKAQTRVCNGDILTYFLLTDGNQYGVEITLTEKGKTSSNRCLDLCRRKIIALRFLRELTRAQVYPIHLSEIIRDFDFAHL